MNEKMDVFAFYLPQFHECDANNQFWSNGFTDWVTTRNATPLYSDHFQPVEPLELGYYDLSTVESIKKQASLARKFGIRGFAIYHYWFSTEERALEKPIELIKENDEVEIDYFICWVNSDWTKSWIGESKEVIRKQEYNVELYSKIFEDACTHFKEDRYYKINNKPLFYIHYPKFFDVEEFIEHCTPIAKNNGFDDVIWIAPKVHTHRDQYKLFDYLIGYPPGDFSISNAKKIPFVHKVVNKIFSGCTSISWVFQYLNIFSYEEYVKKYYDLVKFELERDEKYIPTILHSWDNTPRYKYNGWVFENSDPQLNCWLYRNVFSLSKRKNVEFCLIKAWNEWAEGNALEPDNRYGHGRLEALRKALNEDS